jgi:hypothetical protein
MVSPSMTRKTRASSRSGAGVAVAVEVGRGVLVGSVGVVRVGEGRWVVVAVTAAAAPLPTDVSTDPAVSPRLNKVPLRSE